ncbi:unnamed protein product, partial [Gongylonema pulchrum]|uniref:Remorin_C domain-containing protein n=1 Tax=Gongylonema pulchrum TaxID=637853 RepID=A0A183ES48_9BILA
DIINLALYEEEQEQNVVVDASHIPVLRSSSRSGRPSASSSSMSRNFSLSSVAFWNPLYSLLIKISDLKLMCGLIEFIPFYIFSETRLNLISTFKKRTRPQRAWKGDIAVERKYTRLSESSRFRKWKSQLAITSEASSNHVPQLNNFALHLFALHFLRQQHPSHPCQHLSFTPFSASVQKGTLTIKGCNVFPESSRSTNSHILQPFANSGISAALRTPLGGSSYKHFYSATLANNECRAKDFCEEANKSSPGVITLHRLEAEIFAIGDDRQRQDLLESMKVKAKKLENKDRSRSEQENWHINRAWNPCHGHIYDDVKNCVIINEVGQLQQSQICNTAPEPHPARSLFLERNRLRSRIPVLMTRLCPFSSKL